MKTRDIDIRKELRHTIYREFHNSDSIVINELDLCHGAARVDMAVVNGALHGYEIKSDRDNLERLPNQIQIYNRFFDYITIVCGEKYLVEVCGLVPEWWGILEAKANIEAVVNISLIRSPKINPQIDPRALLQMLWREEIISALLQVECDKQRLRYPKFKLINFLLEYMELPDIQEYVRACIKAREGWRPDAIRMSCGG